VPPSALTTRRMLPSRALTRTRTGPLSRRLISSTLQRRHNAVRTACANSPQMAGTVHLSEKLLIDEHVGTLCALLRSGESPVDGTRRIFLERNNIGDTGADSCVEGVVAQPCSASRLSGGSSPDGNKARLELPREPFGPTHGQSAAWSALAGHAAYRPCTVFPPSIGAKQLASLLEGGATPAVTSIRLYMNEIGDEGAAALVRAALSGAVPKLKSISLDPCRNEHRPGPGRTDWPGRSEKNCPGRPVRLADVTEAA
jgi:hypothetical protein